MIHVLLIAYAFVPDGTATRPLDAPFPPPAGMARVEVEEGSFGAWLRRLPLRPPGAPVRSFKGVQILAGDDPRLAAVAELDVGTRDLQQCADSILRLHAEWMWDAGRAGELDYPLVDGKRVSFRGTTREAFRRYLVHIFAYASTLSLDKYARKVDRADVRPGDFFVMGGSPGHAVLILDIARDKDGRRAALLGQGFMPAQDFHVLRAPDGTAWFPLDGDEIATPFWRPFRWKNLRRL
ncbi:MAG TPA: DUF4846 domain-containing protein [Haliangiales bacterium]|nr:DUF4846 domain-containing protein [Haliangiales bacterium]